MESDKAVTNLATIDPTALGAHGRSKLDLGSAASYQASRLIFPAQKRRAQKPGVRSVGLPSARGVPCALVLRAGGRNPAGTFLRGSVYRTRAATPFINFRTNKANKALNLPVEY